MRRACATVGLAFASLAPAACGESDGERARDAVGSFLAACVERDERTVLDVLTGHADQVFLSRAGVANGCRAVLGLPQAPNPRLHTARVIRLRIDARHGRGGATVAVAEGWRRDVPLVRAGGEWRVGPALSASRRSPGSPFRRG